MLSDDVQSKVLHFCYKGFTVTARIVLDLIFRYANAPQAQRQTYGKQSIKELNKKNRALENIPVAGMDLQGLQRELRQYGVDYAVTARKSEPGVFDIYFKGGDVNQIQTALRTYAWNHLNRQRRPSIQERMRSALNRAVRQETPQTGRSPRHEQNLSH